MSIPSTSIPSASIPSRSARACRLALIDHSADELRGEIDRFPRGVRNATARGKPLIADFGDGIVTTLVGGYALTSGARPSH